MREVKKHWRDKSRPLKRGAVYVVQRTLCGREFVLGGWASMKRKVTCKTCAKILRGYGNER